MRGRWSGYLLVNLAFACVIVGVLGYSRLFRGDGHPIPSIYAQLTGHRPPSQGLSASFSEMVRGNVPAARNANPYGPRVFGFFAIQLVLRVVGIALLLKGIRVDPGVVLADAGASTLLFLWSFAPFIRFLGRQAMGLSSSGCGL